MSRRTSTRIAEVPGPQVLAWRMSRQLMEPRGTASASEVARAICGAQAQVGSAAELAIAVRQRSPRPGKVEKAPWKDRSL